MLTELHNRYNQLPADADICLDRNLNDLMMFAIDSTHVDFDGDSIIFTQAPGFPAIEIERIVGAEDLGKQFAIILPTSIILIDKQSGNVKVHLPE